MEKKMRHILLIVISMLHVSMVHGQAFVSGWVHEQDSITPIVGASIVFSGYGTEGDTLLFQAFSDTAGYYQAEVENGIYQVAASAEGYSTKVIADSLLIENGVDVDDFNWVLYEVFSPVCYVEATILYDDFVRIAWTMQDSVSPDTLRSFRYFELFRRRFDEEPVGLISHLTDTVFMDMHWGHLDWGQYCWGVSCHYEGNRNDSDTVWSAYLDKDMTTSLTIEVHTNVGLPSEGALVSVESEWLAYQDTIGPDGIMVFDSVFRGNYSLQVSMEGFSDYVSDSTILVVEPTQVSVELQEAIRCLDSLYVSSTGWAVWHLSDTLSRGLQFFDIQVDGTIVAQTTDTCFQLDVSGCESGMTYSVAVRPVYLSSNCDWVSFDWLYSDCSEFQSVDDFSSTIMDDAVLLEWSLPEGDTVLGVMLSRDGVELGLVEGERYMDSTVIMDDYAVYALKVVYGGEKDGHYLSMSCETLMTVEFPVYCEPPAHLEGEPYYEDDNDFGALISWGDRPPLIEDWLFYDNGDYKNSVGGGDEPVLFWSIRFDEEDLVDYQGSMLTKVSVFDVGAGSYQLWVYIGGENAPQAMACTQSMTFSGNHQWHDELLATAVEIPENGPIWVVVGQQGLNRPAAACADMGNPNGRWISLNGSDWNDLHHYNLHYTWMLRAFVTNRKGREISIDDDFILQQYNLYRSVDNIDYQQIASVSFNEGQSFYQFRDRLVGTSYDRYYYRLTALYRSENGKECESDYAASLLYPEQYYVMVDDILEIPECQENGVIVYPNPVADLLHIEAKDGCRLDVFNALGQCMISEKLAKDETQLDFSSFPNGLYLLKVETKNGVASRRFVVAH